MKHISLDFALILSVLLCVGMAPTFRLAAQTAKDDKKAVAVATTSFPENLTAPPPVRPTEETTRDDYQLGIGDVIHVSVWRDQELTQTAVVRPDGKISLPLMGEISVAGKTATSVKSQVRDRLLQFVTDPQVTVSVLEIHSRQVYITGQVQRPGAYPLVGSINVLQLIASAGGLTPFAHKKGIVILDATQAQKEKFDYASAIQGKDKHNKLILSPGDTVVVP
jgi:polysaccharide export outer membrane protein